jgi:hypothetical protein
MLMAEMKNAYEILPRKSVGKGPFGNLELIRGIKLNEIFKLGCENVV